MNSSKMPNGISRYDPASPASVPLPHSWNAICVLVLLVAMVRVREALGALILATSKDRCVVRGT